MKKHNEKTEGWNEAKKGIDAIYLCAGEGEKKT